MGSVPPADREHEPIVFIARPAWDSLEEWLGEYDRPGDASYVQARARSLSFRLVWEEAPHVISALQRGPLACYSEAQTVFDDWRRRQDETLHEWATQLSWTDDSEWEDWHASQRRVRHALYTWENLTSTVTGASVPPQEFVALWREMSHWSQLHCLTANWCLSRAFTMLVAWYEQETDPSWEGPDDEDIWTYLGEEYPRPRKTAVPIKVSFVPWHPYEETRAAAARRIQSDLQRQVEAHLDHTTHELYAAGSRRIASQSWHHIEWLFRYQIQGESSTRVAAEARVERKTVEAGVRKAAALLGLCLRPPKKGGRPRKSAVA